MAQVIKLKRSSVAGKAPTTSDLQLGELGVNTADGKIYFEKNNGLSPSVETIVTTNSQTTGSIEITGNISGSLTSTGSLGRVETSGDINSDGRIFEQDTSVIDHATAMAIVFGG